MKQLTCEMCGSTDLMKDGGVFVCQTCGCKYSVEEARRMMVEGTVDVRGTVQVDNSAFVKKYLENARRAKEKEDWEETEKYYNMVEQNDPNNIEAIFYSAYGKTKSSLVDGDIYKRQAVFNVLKNCISILDDKFDVNRRDENETVIRNISTDLGNLISSGFVYNEWTNEYGQVVKTNKSETYKLFMNLVLSYKETIKNIEKIDDQRYLHEASLYLYRVAKNIGMAKKFDEAMDLLIFSEELSIERFKLASIDAYWKEHKEEEAQLEHERSSLIDKITALKKNIDTLPEASEVKGLKKQINSLELQKSYLGLFKGKEKKALQEKIDNLMQSLSSAQSANNKAVSAIQAEISKLQNRINEINTELRKER